jgi:CheY-like chemotaxis protein
MAVESGCNRKGWDTEAHFILPYHNKENRDMANKEHIRGEPLNILLVEDNLAHAELVIRSLRDHRIINEIEHLSNGEAALDYLFRRKAYANAEHSPRPHLILLDLRLPRVDGLEVLKEIKCSDDLRTIPVVILTTSEAEQDVARAYQYYANSYLAKPVDFTKFVRLIEDLGFYWLAWNCYVREGALTKKGED